MIDEIYCVMNGNSMGKGICGEEVHVKLLTVEDLVEGGFHN